MAWIANVVQRVVGVGTSIAQTAIASEELAHLPGFREYSLNQDLATATALARKGAQQGMTPEERAVAGQAIGTQQSRTQRAMEQRGLGSLAAAISQSSATDAFNKLEAQNQQIKRDYLTTYGNLGSKVQAMENANVTSFNQQLALQQQELGKAAQAGARGIVAGLGASIGQLANTFSDPDVMDYWSSRQAENVQTAFNENPLQIDKRGGGINDGTDAEFAQLNSPEEIFGQFQNAEFAEYGSTGESMMNMDPKTGFDPYISNANSATTDGMFEFGGTQMSSFDASSVSAPAPAAPSAP